MKNPYESDRIFHSDTGGIGETRGVGGILADVWRKTLSTLNVPPPRFETMLNEYVANMRHLKGESRLAKVFTKGNLRREFEKPSMSFKVLMKGFKLINVVRVRISFELEFGSGAKCYVETSADLGRIDTSTPSEPEDEKKTS
jgi:hypothetical protein